MHIPSDRVYKEIRSEEAGVWFVPANGGDETAILIKVPTTSAKSLLIGAKLEMLLGVKKGFLCSGVRIFDVPEAPLLVCRVQRHAEEHGALLRISEMGTSPVFIFNEMDVCISWSSISISEADRKPLAEFLTGSSAFYSGEFSKEAITVLDTFCEITDVTQQALDTSLKTLVIPLSCAVWISNQVSFAGISELHTISISDPEEGEALERAVWASLESVFPFTLRKAPEVVEGKKTRELTDVLASHEYGTFLIEAKDLSVLQAGITRNRERRLKGTQKQALKAISQLVGASKILRSGSKVSDASGNPITLKLDQPMHCIVLLTELMHEGDWTDVASALLAAAQETREFFHLLDFRELINVLKLSNGDPGLVDYNLMKRFECLVETHSVHVRSRSKPA